MVTGRSIVQIHSQCFRVALLFPPRHAIPANMFLGAGFVILINGTVDFLTAEITLALRRAYDIMKLPLVESLGVEHKNERAHAPLTTGRNSTTRREGREG